MSDITYVYIAYTIIFGGLAAYVFYLHQKQMKIAQDIEPVALQRMALNSKRKVPCGCPRC
jgi:CcmD family protein